MSELLSSPDLREQLSQSVVSGLYRYPIKSCAGEMLNTAIITPKGIEHDRELMIVAAGPYQSKGKRKETGEFLTQRELPQMSLIFPNIINNRLVATAPDMPFLDLPLTKFGPIDESIIWGKEQQTVDQGEEAAEWLTSYLGVGVRLVRMAEEHTRQVDQRYAPRPTDQVDFADGYPFLMISQESLRDLNRRLPEALSMDRFRPNIVIEGSGIPYAEDFMQQAQIGDITIDIVKPCGRCIITTTDQATGERGAGNMAGEPLRTLRAYRYVELDGKKEVIFGQNLTHADTGTVNLGDRVNVQATQRPFVEVASA